MRISNTILLAILGAVSARELDSLKEAFFTISASDTAGYSRWINSYVDAYKTEVDSYFSEYGSVEGYSTEEIASLEKSLDSLADQQRTVSYSDVYSRLIAEYGGAYSDYSGDYDDYSDYSYLTDDFSGLSDGANGLAYDSKISTLTSGKSGVASLTSHGTSGGSSTAQAGSHVTSSSASQTDSASGTASSGAASSGFSGSASSGSSRGSSAASSSNTGSSSAGFAGHQAPMIVGAALAGISVLLL